VNIERVREMDRPVAPKVEYVAPPPTGYSFAPGARVSGTWVV
jgi:hypothetical protein